MVNFLGHSPERCKESSSQKRSVTIQRPRHSEDSWSDEEGLNYSEEDTRRRARSRQSYSTLSSEGAASEEENTSEHSHATPDQMLSSLSAENLQLELANCHSDGLSDKENVVRRMKHQVKQSPERMLPSVDSSDSSESDECSDMTVATAVHKPSRPDQKNW